MSRLKVFKYCAVGDWNGGCILVAANSQEEADETVNNQTHYIIDENSRLGKIYAEGEIENLIYNGDPCIIFDELYFEY